MLSRLANIFRVPDLRNKVVFTLAVIALYQIGANVPVPGVNWARLQTLESSASASGVLGFLNLFSGGALVRLAVFGLGVMPYITSSIIIQLLSTVIPKLEEWRDQGAVGQKKITQTTRYLTVALAVMQSSGLVYAFHGHDSALLGTSVDLIPTFTWPLALFMVLILTAGTATVMWRAELITQRGIGQGMSILIFAMVLAGLLSERKAERCQERPSFLVGACGRHDGDVHAAGRVDLVVVDLGEDQLLGHPERVVAVAVERPG